MTPTLSENTQAILLLTAPLLAGKATATTDLLSPFFDDFLTRPFSGGRNGRLLGAPEADVIETEKEIRVLLEMPGMTSDEIEIGLENNVLTISGEKRQERSEDDERNRWHLSERRYGRFSRSFVLPRDVESDRIEARFEHGELRVTVPKSEKARRRRIEIQGEDGGRRLDVGNG